MKKYLPLLFFLLIPIYLMAYYDSNERIENVNDWNNVYISQLNDKKEALEYPLNSSSDVTKISKNENPLTSDIEYYFDIADKALISSQKTQISTTEEGVLEIPVITKGYNRYGHELSYSFTECKFKLVDEYKLLNISDWKLGELPEDMFTLSNFENPNIGNNSTSKLFTYKDYGSYNLQLEVDIPNGEGPFPFMIWIHGGGWEAGDYQAFNYMSRYFADRGIAGVRISYSLLPQGGTMPIAWQDIQDALAFVQKKAGELRLKSEVFGFIGHSAGAHLSAYAAMRTPGTKLLVGFNGAYDLNTVKPKYEPNDHHFQFLGQTYQDRYVASPINFVHAGAPHSFLTYGTGDFYVDPEQIINFAAKLRESGVSVETLTKDYCSHSAFIGSSEEFVPILSKLSKLFNQYLK